jgi:hypothetical protein
MACFVLVLDTPGIKQFVFGTDALAEVRGASALLDRLNRCDTEERLRQHVTNEGGEIKKVFANGGTAQFVVEAADRSAVQAAVDALAAYYAEETGGEVRPLAGVAEWPQGQNYHAAVAMAHAELQLRRNLGFGRPTIPILPIVQECESTSHLPAQRAINWGGERLILSEASRLKREEAAASRRGLLWTAWMESLDLPGDAHANALRLRPPDVVAIGRAAERQGYIGLVYADGNAMGRLVQELDSTEVCRAFSELVDGSLRDACYGALRAVLGDQVEAAQKSLTEGGKPDVLPADILLLGGDDLLVVLPAERALDFALHVTQQFADLTRSRQETLPGPVRAFFANRGLAERGLTISCGVAIGPARYPFYLLLDLAEELLRSAKAAGSRHPERSDYWAPTYVDFHQIAGSESPELETIREEDYLVKTEYPRTLRPYSGEQLMELRAAANILRAANVPRSKLHDLFEAALEPRPVLAQIRARELFGRLRQDSSHPEREALWDALAKLGSVSPFPWTGAPTSQGAGAGQPSSVPFGPKPGCKTALADLIEAHELFGTTHTYEPAGERA